MQEKDIVLDIGLQMREMLNQYSGVQVRLSRADDRYLTLSERTNMANAWGVDYFVSIHVNAGGGTGFESFVWNGGVTQATVANQNIMHREIMRQIGGTDRGKKRANFAVLRQTNMPAILTENMFIDTAADARKLKDSTFIRDVAQGHVNGIVQIFGLQGGGSTQTSSANLTEDGKWGPATTRALQQTLGTVVDGVISNQRRNNVTQALYGDTARFSNNGNSLVIRALQNKVGATVDGLLGPDTARRTQSYLGTPVDGVISRPSSVMVREMQRKLNSGTF